MRVFSRKFQNSYRRKIVNTKYIFTKSSLEDAQSTPLSENMSSITARYEFFDKSIGGAPLLPFWNRQDFCCRSYRKMLFFVEITGVGQNGAVFSETACDLKMPEIGKVSRLTSNAVSSILKNQFCILGWKLPSITQISFLSWKITVFQNAMKSVLRLQSNC